MTKKEILKLYRWRCNHGHNGISHYNCYCREGKKKEKIGYLDIETSNLKANFGIILCYCIKPQGSNRILHNTITKKDLQTGDMDKNLVRKCVRDMRKFDRIVGHYSSRFDLPFVRTRALIHKLDFPKYGEILQTDTWTMAKNCLALHSNRQAVIAETLLGKTVKTRIKQAYWIKALQGDRKAIDYVLDHCIKDVKDLEKDHLKLLAYSRKTSKSI
jgi:DNA polymerase elongation subunit (family B)